MIRKLRRPRRGAAVLLSLFLVLFSLLPAQAASGRTDSQLLSDAYTAYGKGDWLQAALLFSAYLDRSPALLADAQRRQNIEACYRYARSRLQDGLVAAGDMPDVRKMLFNCQADLRSCQTGLGTNASYLTAPTPTPPEPLPLPAEAGGPSYPLVCRGGGGLYFTYTPFSSYSSRPQMWIQYEKAPAPVGMAREAIGSLNPGQCSWLDRAAAGAEPGEIHLREPLFGVNDFAIAWTGGRVMGTTSGAPFTSLQSSDRYVTFFVYNDRQGNFVATDVRDCTPGPEEVAVFVDFDYRSGCRVLPGGSYPSAEAIGLPNDSISSVMVGSGAQAYLCQHQNLAGTCERFSADDASLSDNSIGNDQVTSLRVEVPVLILKEVQPGIAKPFEITPK